MGARLGHNPSFVWRSIFSSRAVVELGTRWKIGNGESISVWRDPWLKGGNDSFVRSTMPVGLEDMRVRDLWRPETSDWNRDLVNNIFNAQEASRILAMPMLNIHDDDKVVWWRSRSGSYSVKSAYYTYMENLFEHTNLRIEGEWNRIWKLKVPNKVKLLIWRACRGCLPTRCNLQNRHVPCEWLCPFCGRNPENEWHIFFACEHNEGAWKIAGLWDQLQRVMDSAESFREGCFALFGALSEDLRKSAAMVLWALWKRRNDKVWEGTVQPLSLVVRRAMDFLFDWVATRPRKVAAASLDVDGGGARRSEVGVAWEKPPLGSYKCNVDAAMFESENKYGIGICIRSDSGAFFKAKSLWFNGLPSPKEAEAMGLWQALLWLRDLGLSLVSIELDCLPVVDGVREDTNTDTEFGTLLSYCKNFLSTFQSFKVGFIRRQANRAAHSLARAARFHASSFVFDYIPTCIETIIINEMS